MFICCHLSFVSAGSDKALNRTDLPGQISTTKISALSSLTKQSPGSCCASLAISETKTHLFHKQQDDPWISGQETSSGYSQSANDNKQEPGIWRSCK